MWDLHCQPPQLANLLHHAQQFEGFCYLCRPVVNAVAFAPLVSNSANGQRCEMVVSGGYDNRVNFWAVSSDSEGNLGSLADGPVQTELAMELPLECD